MSGMIRTTYRASSPYNPGTGLPMSVTGECDHRHRTPEAVEECIGRLDRAIKRGHGPSAYCDRIVMVEHDAADMADAGIGRQWDRHAMGRCAECPACVGLGHDWGNR